MKLARYSTRRTPHGASRLVLAMFAWSVKTRRAPSRHCRDANVYGHKTTAIHDNEYLVHPPLVWPEQCRSRDALGYRWKAKKTKAKLRCGSVTARRIVRPAASVYPPPSRIPFPLPRRAGGSGPQQDYYPSPSTRLYGYRGKAEADG